MVILNNKKGSILALMLPFITLLGILFFGFTTGWSTLKQDFQASQICRTELKAIQNQIGGQIKKLLALNSLATALRIQKKVLIVQLGSCLAIPATCDPTILLRFQKVLEKQKKLDAVQKSIIENSRMQSQARLAATSFKISRLKRFFEFWKSHLIIKNLPKSKMAVTPGDLDLAPTYQLAENFIHEQKVAIKWRHFFFNRHTESTFLSSAGQTTNSGCAASLNEKLDAVLSPAKHSQNSWSY